MSSLTIPHCSCFLSPLLPPSLCAATHPVFAQCFSRIFYPSPELFGLIISTLLVQRTFLSISFYISTCSALSRFFMAAWQYKRARVLLIKFHSFLASLFFRFSQPHLNCAGIEMAVALISHSAPILRSRFPFLSRHPSLARS